MIAYVKGLLDSIEPDRIVVEAGQIGYEIQVPLSVLERLPAIGQEVKVYTYFQVKEDGVGLFGFLNRQDLKMFQQLLKVNGIGPKGALAILSAMTPDRLRTAIVSGDAKQIAKAQGIGIKTAQRVILDLKDKISDEELLAGFTSGEVTEAIQTVPSESMKGMAKDAVDALIALGYSAAESSKAVRQVELTDTMDGEQILKAALRFLF